MPAHPVYIPAAPKGWALDSFWGDYGEMTRVNYQGKFFLEKMGSGESYERERERERERESKFRAKWGGIRKIFSKTLQLLILGLD